MGLANYDPDVRDQFLNDLQREDEVGMILRAHIHIEHAIIEILEAQTPNGDLIAKANLRYEQRITIAAAFGAIRRDLLGPLKKIGELRNKFAHRLGYKIGSQDVGSFVNAFSKMDREIMAAVYAKTQRNSAETRPDSFTDLEAIDKFILAVVILRQALVAEFRKCARYSTSFARSS
jgi:hypothetical protein